ncbi:MAG: MlaA family lipoprotein [Alphaproteobacteria bacterium]
MKFYNVSLFFLAWMLLFPKNATADMLSANGESVAASSQDIIEKPQFSIPTILPLPTSNILPESAPIAKTDIKTPKKISGKISQKAKTNSIQSGSDLNNLFEDNARAAIPDPNETTNRQILDFNVFLDRAFLKPISTIFGIVTPDPVEQILRNIFTNLEEPSKFLFLTFSGHLADGLLTLSRFTINSTIGIGGAFDPASSFTPSLKSKDANADLMLAKWGIPKGNYSMAFFTGPSHQRAGIAGYANRIINPSGIILNIFLPERENIVRWGTLGGKAILNRPAALDALTDFADPYAVAKSVYWQNYQGREQKFKSNK